MTLDMTHLGTWRGRTETARDVVTPWLVAAFRAMLDIKPVAEDAESAVPLGLHWCLAQPTVAQSAIGEDGHPARGGFLPPVPLPRRMWAGGRLTFERPLTVGAEIERRSTVLSVDLKEGRTGSLVFVVVGHEVSGPDGLVVREEHDIVYRGLEAPAVRPGRSTGGGPAERADVSRTVEPSPVLLFRYSALTYNGHRIHYDRTYVTEVEKYPGLIVHGPLQATLLLQLAEEMAGGQIRSFAFRALKPLFDTAPFAVNGRQTSEGLSLWVSDSEGDVTMSATAR